VSLLQVRGAAATAATLGCTTCANAVTSLDNSTQDAGYGLVNVGARYAVNDNLTVWGELSKTHVKEALLVSTTSWQLGTSYIVEKWTPYVVWSGVKINDFNAKKVDAAQIAALPSAQLRGAMAAYNTTGGGIYPGNNARQTWSVGTRYDLMNNVALKADWTTTRFKTPSESSLYGFPTVAGAAKEKSVDLYTIAVDFVF
jgi:hypothetical protein